MSWHRRGKTVRRSNARTNLHFGGSLSKNLSEQLDHFTTSLRSINNINPDTPSDQPRCRNFSQSYVDPLLSQSRNIRIVEEMDKKAIWQS